MDASVTDDSNRDVMGDRDPDAPKSYWQRYRLPIILGVIAVSFYGLSIVAIMFGRGAAA